MELKNKYFHGVQSYNYYGNITERQTKTLNDILQKYEYILKCGYILPYKNIKELYGDITRHPIANYNGDDRISITLHEKKIEEYDLEWKKKHYYYNEESAFRMFILEAEYSSAIVLNEKIKDKYNLIQNGMYLERQISEPISLEYMDAITIFPNSNIAKYFENEEDLKKHGHYYQDDFNIEFLNKLKELLIKYGYNVPIVSIITGHAFNEKENNTKKLTKIKKNYLKD